MRSRAEMKQAAKEALKGNWTDAVLFALVIWIAMMAISLLAQPNSYETIVTGGMPIEVANYSLVNRVFFVLNILAGAPIGFAMTKYFYRLSQKQKVSFDILLAGFERFVSVLVLYLRMVIQVIAWSLLLVIPGIIAGFRYAQVFYILNEEKENTGENPWTRAGRILKESGALMAGYKWDYFVLGLSFIGWVILAMIPVGLGYLWLMPYMMTTYGNFYQDLKGRLGVKKMAAKIAVAVKNKAKKN